MKILFKYEFMLMVIAMSAVVISSCCKDDDTNNNNNPTDTHEYVDLGLPSGTLWATCNVGATNPEDYGSYFAWGETSTKTTFSASTYTYSKNDSVLGKKYDAATSNWGETWRMPTMADWKELYNNCTWKYTNQNGVNGHLLTGHNGKSIFLPAAGFCVDNNRNVVGSGGYYWSSTIYDKDNTCARDTYWGTNYVYTSNYMVRHLGMPIRPVRFK